MQCIYTLCRRGTPRLAYINRHYIQAYWVEFLYDELNTVLCKVCSCKDHLYGEPIIVQPEVNGEDQPDNAENNENVQVPAGVQGHIVQVEAAINMVPNVNNAVIQAVDPPLANIVPLFPLLDDDDMREDNVKPGPSNEKVPNASSKGFGDGKYVIDDAVPSTSTDPRAQGKGKSCAKFKAKRSKSLPVPLQTNESESSDADDQDIPIEHSTVEVRSTPRINDLPFIGAPTHVAVIPIRVVDPRILPQTPALNPVPIAIQSIALQPQVIAVDKATGTHVVSGPLTVVKHIIQVIPKTTTVPTATVSSAPASENSESAVTLESGEPAQSETSTVIPDPIQNATTTVADVSNVNCTVSPEPAVAGTSRKPDESVPPEDLTGSTQSDKGVTCAVDKEPNPGEIDIHKSDDIINTTSTFSGKTRDSSVVHDNGIIGMSSETSAEGLGFVPCLNTATGADVVFSMNSDEQSEIITSVPSPVCTMIASNSDVLSENSGTPSTIPIPPANLRSQTQIRPLPFPPKHLVASMELK